MKDIIEKINQKLRNNDFVQLYSEFEELNKEVEKGSKNFEKDGVPRFYIRIIATIENFVMSFSQADKKKLSVNNNKSYNILKQKIKKHNQSY
jgi:translation initiation factor 3 subunit C